MDLASFNYTDMKYLATLQNQVPVNDTAGGQTDHYVSILTTRMYLEKAGSSRDTDTGRLTLNKDYIGICNWQSAIVINTDSQFVIRGIVYQVLDYEEVGQIPQYYIFKLSKSE